MTLALRLEEMSVPEKLQLMEALWQDLSLRDDSVESPAWHGEVLEKRERLIASGQAQFIDWEQARAEIRRECLEDMAER